MSTHKAWHHLRDVDEYKNLLEQTVMYALKLCKYADTGLLLRIGNVVGRDEPGMHQYQNALDERYYHNRRRLILAMQRGLNTKSMGMARQAVLIMNDHWIWYQVPTLDARIIFKQFQGAVETLVAYEKAQSMISKGFGSP